MAWQIIPKRGRNFSGRDYPGVKGLLQLPTGENCPFSCYASVAEKSHTHLIRG